MEKILTGYEPRIATAKNLEFFHLLISWGHQDREATSSLRVYERYPRATCRDQEGAVLDSHSNS